MFEARTAGVVFSLDGGDPSGFDGDASRFMEVAH